MHYNSTQKLVTNSIKFKFGLLFTTITSSFTFFLMETIPDQDTLKEVPRQYQLDLYQKAKDCNVIAVLDTGTGKTLIALLMLKHIHSICHTDKFSVFLVPTVPLVSQQAHYMSINSSLRVFHLWGGLLDASWTTLIGQYDVFVMTPSILLSALDQGLCRLSQLALLIFDECHHCRQCHPYNLIMSHHYDSCPVEKRPKIFGMTASPFGSNDQSKQAIQQLEKNLDSIALSSLTPTSLQQYVSKPTERIVYYSQGDFFDPPKLYVKIMQNCPKLFEFVEKEMGDCMVLFDLLGPWAADRALEIAVEEISLLIKRKIRELEMVDAEEEFDRLQKERESANGFPVQTINGMLLKQLVDGLSVNEQETENEDGPLENEDSTKTMAMDGIEQSRKVDDALFDQQRVDTINNQTNDMMDVVHEAQNEGRDVAKETELEADLGDLAICNQVLMESMQIFGDQETGETQTRHAIGSEMDIESGEIFDEDDLPDQENLLKHTERDEESGEIFEDELEEEDLLSAQDLVDLKRKGSEILGEEYIFKAPKTEKNIFAGLTKKELIELLKGCDMLQNEPYWGERALPPLDNEIGAKVNCLVNVLLEFQADQEFFCGIVFCHQRLMAHVLKLLIQKHKSLPFIKCEYLLGHGGKSSGLYKKTCLTATAQKEIVMQFRSGEINLLIATSVAEEGLDIKPCNCVVRFDMLESSLTSYIQSRGRARHRSSQFIIIAKQGEDIAEQTLNCKN
jgi:ERCC4-related helicase